MTRIERFNAPRDILAIAVFVVAAVSAPSGRSSDLAVEGRNNAYPSIAANGRFVALTWGASTKEGATDIYSVSSTDGGRTFGRPTQVNDASSQASLSGEQPPRIALVPGPKHVPSIVVTWTAKAAGGTRLLAARSDDGGQSFSRPGALPGSDAPGNRGWEATATDRDGRVVAVWLDHRELAQTAQAGAPTSHAGHQHGASSAQQQDGAARAQLSKLFFARLGNGETARELTGGVCYCCKTAIATGSDGAIYAAWRHVYPGNIRDIAFTMSRDGGRTFTPPARVSDDKWVIDGCPENGPAVAVDDRGRIHVVWPTLVPGTTRGSEPTLALFYAFSRDGLRFTPRQLIPTEGFPRHPQIALDSRGEAIVAWDEQASGIRRVAIGRGTVDDNGTARFIRQLLTGGQAGTYPVVATTDGGAIVAWTSGTADQRVVRVEQVPK